MNRLIVALMFAVLLLAAPDMIAQSCAACVSYGPVTCQGVQFEAGRCGRTSSNTDCNVGYRQCSDPVFQYSTCMNYPDASCYNANFLTSVPKDPELGARLYVPDCKGNFVQLPHNFVQVPHNQPSTAGGKIGGGI